MKDVMPRFYLVVVRLGAQYAIVRVSAYSARDARDQVQIDLAADWSTVGHLPSGFAKPLPEAQIMSVGPSKLTYLTGSSIRGCLANAWTQPVMQGKDPYSQIEGEDWQIVDIGMRMLTPRELARCQGFDDSYVFTDKTKSDQVARIGNSVPPPIAAAIVRANYSEVA